MGKEAPFDLVAIGGGVGGLVASVGAAQLGAKVALVEKTKLGGDCLNYGCVPSKGLIRAARLAAQARSMPAFGIDAGDVRVDFPRVMKRMKAAQARIGEHDAPERFEGMGIEVIFGDGAFTGPDTFQAGDRTLRARRFLLATGSSPFVPPVPGLGSVPYLTNETVFDLEELPRRLVVLGAGPIGLELSQAFHQLGAEVDVLQRAPKLLPRLDAEMAALLADCLKKSGLRLHFEADAQKIEKRGDEIFIEADTPSGKREWVCDQLLVAAGRSPNVGGMELERAGVRHTPRGVETDAHLRTSNPRVFAAGDVRGQYLFTHMAEYEAGVALRNMLFSAPFGVPLPFLRKKANYDAVPWTIYTTPEAAHVGLGEAEARAALGENRAQVLRFPMSRVDRAVLDGETEGLCKVVCDEKGRLVGADLVGPSAGEILHEFVLAVRKKMRVREVVDTVHVYPTLAQVNKRAVGRFYARRLFTPAFRKKMRRVFGLRGRLEVRDPADSESHASEG